MPDENSLLLLKAAIKEVLEPEVKKLHDEIHAGKEMSKAEIDNLKNKFEDVSKQVCTTGDCVNGLKSSFNDTLTNLQQEQKDFQDTLMRQQRMNSRRREPENEITEEEVLGKYLNFCPQCDGGHKIGNNTLDALCVGCGSQVSSSWKSCPNCGGNQAVPMNNDEVQDVYTNYKDELKRLKQL